MKFLQWFYNPFKPHICRLSTGEYVIRRYRDWDWECLDRNQRGNLENIWWCTEKNIMKYCTFRSLVVVKQMLENYQSYESESKPITVKYTERVL